MTLERITSQRLDGSDCEILIIDDGSTDGTWEMLAGFRAPMPLRILRNDQNQGRARSRNRGIREAQGEFVLMIDDDIWAEPGLVLEHLRMHKSAAAPVAVVGAILPEPIEPANALELHLRGHHVWCHTTMMAKKEGLPPTFCKTANLSLPRRILLDIGLFADEFVLYGSEDTDLGLRLEKARVPLLYCVGAIGYHHEDATIDSIVRKERERAQTLRQLSERFPVFGSPNGGFFSAGYHPWTSMRFIAYNISKRLLFLPSCAKLTEALVRLMNGSGFARRFTAHVLIPLLRTQVLHAAQKNHAQAFAQGVPGRDQ